MMDDWPHRLVQDFVTELSSGIKIKVFDVNRSLASWTATRVNSIDIDGDHGIVFAKAFPSIYNCVMKDLNSVEEAFSATCLVRLHKSA